MIEQLVGFADNVVAFRCLGRVTKPDYRSVLVPAVTEALRRQRKVRLYYETGPDFSLDPGAAWEHFKVGVRAPHVGSTLPSSPTLGGSSMQCSLLGS